MSRDLTGVKVSIFVGSRAYSMEDLNAYRVEVTDSEEGDSTITLQCNDEDYRVTDNLSLQVGESLGIQWGYTLTNEVSTERSGYVVVKPSTIYGEDGVLAVIKASTTSVLMSARRPQKSYGKLSLKSIVSDIANRNKLKLTITGGDELVSGFSMGKWSDREALRVLADRYGYLATYTTDGLDFAKRDFNQKPARTFYYKQGEGSNIISAEVQQDHAKDMGAGEAVTRVSSNPAKKTTDKTEVKQVRQVDLAVANPSAHVVVVNGTPTVVESTNSSTGTPGGVTGFFAGMGSKVMGVTGGGSKLWEASDVRDLNSMPPSTEAASKSSAIASALNAKTRKAEMTLSVEGEPTLTAKQIINVVGLSKRDSGMWWIIKVTHTLDLQGGYTCNLELARTGHNLKGSGSPNHNVNNQNGGLMSCHSSTTPVVEANLDTRRVVRTTK